MAFPLQTTQLRAQQRSFALASSGEGHQSIIRIVKPLELGAFASAYSKFPEFRPVSPPIPFEFSDPVSENNLQPSNNAHKRNASRITNKGYHVRRKSKAPGSKKKSHNDSLMTDHGRISPQSSINVESLPVNEIDDKKQKEYKNPITKLFTRSERPSHNQSDSDSGSSVGSIPNDSNETIPESSELNYDSMNEENASSLEMSGSDPGTSILDLEGESAEESNDDNSSDSAFTDIEADSLGDSSVNIMYDYTVPNTYVFERDPGVKVAMERSNDKEGMSQGKGASVTPTDSEGRSAFSKLTPLLKRKESFNFEKTYDAVSSARHLKSNLSEMIQMRYNSSNMNPLSYFSFVTTGSANAKHAKIDLFLPPKSKPVLKDLTVATNVSIFDCIGYCLSRLFEGNEFQDEPDKEALMNPNNWRMELIDEDGDLYDSNFGTLDRTRLLSSYNSPRYLALCRAKSTKEIEAHDKQSPLPLELKQNLDLYHKRTEDRIKVGGEGSESVVHNSGWNTTGNSIEVKVNHIPNSSSTKPISFFVASSMQVGGLLDLICRQYQVDMSKYKLVPIIKRANTGLSNTWRMENDLVERRAPLDNSELLSNIDSTEFIMVVDTKNATRSMLDPKTKKETLDESITPSSITFLQGGITPKLFDNETGLEDKESDSRITERKPQEPKATISMKDSEPKTSIEDFMTDANKLLPMNVNTIYYKWKVYRKKSPLLNRIEKSLILDGEYIHLAPTDDTNWKKQFNDNPFSSSTQDTNTHHHHYLHHYNYSKYYNDTMLKTSSFHISRIIKLKQYKDSKTPTHFKIVIEKDNEQGGKESVIKKKYDLEAQTVAQCEEIMKKINWALQVYKLSTAA